MWLDMVTRVTRKVPETTGWKVLALGGKIWKGNKEG